MVVVRDNAGRILYHNGNKFDQFKYYKPNNNKMKKNLQIMSILIGTFLLTIILFKFTSVTMKGVTTGTISQVYINGFKKYQLKVLYSQNARDAFTINKQCYDTIQKYIGKNINVYYTDRSNTLFEASKQADSIKIIP